MPNLTTLLAIERVGEHLVAGYVALVTLDCLVGGARHSSLSVGCGSLHAGCDLPRCHGRRMAAEASFSSLHWRIS